MAYFPHAFKKVFVGSSFVTTGVTTDTLTAGQFGFFNSKTFAPVAVAGATATANPSVILAAGSYHSVDKVGAHGGFKESQKSQIITPRDIQRVWKVVGRAAQQQIVTVGWDGTNANTAPQFTCGQNYHLRIDLTGSPALRLLGRNAYHTFDVFTGCCTNVDTPEAVDPINVLLQFAAQINADPIFSQFVLADVITVDSGDAGTAPDVVNPTTYTVLTDSGDIEAAVGALRLTVAYVDTTFGNASFDPMDHFELEPLIIRDAQLVDETGNPCPEFDQLTFTQSLATITSQGLGERVLRDYILFSRYRQDRYTTDARMREAENMDFVHTAITRSSLYDAYFILHTVGRKSNPSGVYDNDQYLIQLNVPHSTSMTTFESWIAAYLTSVTTGVALENYTGA
jgi:hypothetical protein